MTNDIDRDYLLLGPTEGFRIISRDSELRQAEETITNRQLNTMFGDKVKETIREEIRHGNYIVTTENTYYSKRVGSDTETGQ